MRNNSRQFLEFLLHPPVEYEKNQFDLFSLSFKELGFVKDPVIDSLFQELEIKKAFTDYLIQIIARPDLITTDGNNGFKVGKNGISGIPVVSSELAAMYLSQDINNGLQKRIVIDFTSYLKSISGKLIQKIDPDPSINLKVEDNKGRLVFSRIIGNENGYLAFPFPENLPKWKLLLSENKPGFIATLFKAGSGIYLLIFVLIALFMLLGFIFIIYNLNVEFRLNKMKSEFISKFRTN